MGRSEFVPPTVTYQDGPPCSGFILGAVPSLTPENYDPSLATEEAERLQAETSRAVGVMEIKEFNDLFYQGNIQGE